MTWYANKRLKLGPGWIERDKPVPYADGRNFRLMERRKQIRWENDNGIEAPPKAEKPAEKQRGPTEAEVAAAAAAERAAERAKIVIPEDWAKLPWTPAKKGGESLRALAVQFSDVPVNKKDDALTILQAEVDRRAAAAGGGGAARPGAEVVIPPEWQKMPPADIVALGRSISGNAPGFEPDDAADWITAELEEREKDGKPA